MKPLTLLLFILAAVVFLKLFALLFEARLTFFPFKGLDDTPRHRGIPYEDFRVTTMDGETIHGWKIDHPAPLADILYFHGNGGNLSIWLPILESLHRQGFRIVAPDYRGYGLSTGSPSERGLYRDIDAVVDRYWAQPRRPGIPTLYWGRSLGATMAAYAATRRAPDGLILEGAFPSARSVLTTNPVLAVLGLFSSYRFPTAAFLAGVHVPVLVMHGDADRVIPYRLGEQLYSAIRGRKRFHRIAGGDHNDLSPPHPEAYWGAVRQLVADVGKPKS